ncbi:hypothetical protein Ait01nite_075620 [Actinoplanes italicus]|uniref:Leucine rich repeat (LRR) protein n=1 Tax=Actinoplanes italicus TaxID=113567 RepID=A0A2T0JYN5_9ACTN|nr:HEAT repeat domain-containing protein [Actinoplanes italicus]PRX14654.1 hypothetical protein CLV67_12338 [Actinoplanes italicus]GIE34517.1 hypothetical protein Ait01nite_075620 [Actinoplanes italicus]
MADAALDGLEKNPALPEPLIRRLIARRRGFGRVASRPDLTAGLVEEMIATDWMWLLTSLASNRNLPVPVRPRLVRHRDDVVRGAVAGGAAGEADRDVFERLLHDPDVQARRYLAENDDMPADLRARLAGDPDPSVRALLARSWTEIPAKAQRQLLKDPDDDVRAAACSTYYTRLPHPSMPADLLPELLEDPVTRAGAIRCLALTPEIAARLADDPDYAVRRALARHPDLPDDVRDRLARDRSGTVQAAVFARPDTPPSVRALIHDEVQRKVTDVDDLMDLDDDALIQAVEDNQAIEELRYARLPWVTADPLPHVSSPYPGFRAAAARAAAALPPGVVKCLLDDEDPGVAVVVLRHAPHLVDEATAERLDRANPQPLKGRFRRPADGYPFTPETLRRFAGDPDPRMRALAPRDPALPAAVLAALARDTDAGVRRAAAAHARIPAAELVRLLDDPVDRIAEAAAANPALPRPAMEGLLLRAGL